MKWVRSPALWHGGAVEVPSCMSVCAWTRSEGRGICKKMRVDFDDVFLVCLPCVRGSQKQRRIVFELLVMKQTRVKHHHDVGGSRRREDAAQLRKYLDCKQKV